MIHVQLRMPDGSTAFETLPVQVAGLSNVQVQNAIVAYRDALWPQGINVIYSWMDEAGYGEPTMAPAGYMAALSPAGDQAMDGGLPWWVWVAGGYLLLNVLKKR